MITLHIELEPGFHKADVNSLPLVGNETIFSFIENAVRSEEKYETRSQDEDLRIDYVQLRKESHMCEIHCVVFPAVTGGTSDSHVRVVLKIDTRVNRVEEASCEQCPEKSTCQHILAFLFWLNRVNADRDGVFVGDFWGTETESLAEDDQPEMMRIRDLYACDEMRLEADLEANAVSEIEGNMFLESVLDELDNLGMGESAFTQHLRPVMDEFEQIFIHHTMLDTEHNLVRDTRSFMQHMEDQAKQGLFDRLTEASKTQYKSKLWLEAQYMRLRCSLIHRIASRKDTSQDDEIIERLFCTNRDTNAEERQQLKQHKRFILKQTEKLENKSYSDCGLLLNESYPYICAAPDGITDDHIVEIKVPKTDEEFEKYLECRETIAPKYMAQIQIQMYMANVTKALYCVLSPTFDTNGALHYVWVQADMEFVASLLSAADDFWREIVFPRLAKIYL